MSLEEFRAWERKCLAEAVTNAARLRSRQGAAAAATSSTTAESGTDEVNDTRRTDESPQRQPER